MNEEPIKVYERVLCFIIEKGNEKSTTNELIEGTNLTRPQVHGALTELFKRGVILKERNPGKVGHKMPPNPNLKIKIKDSKYEWWVKRLEGKGFI